MWSREAVVSDLWLRIQTGQNCPPISLLSLSPSSSLFLFLSLSLIPLLSLSLCLRGFTEMPVVAQATSAPAYHRKRQAPHTHPHIQKHTHTHTHTHTLKSQLPACDLSC